LLSALQPEDLVCLELIELLKGIVIYEADESIPFADFPHNAVVSLTSVLPEGESVEMVMIGRESMFGLASALTTRRSIGRLVVQVPGIASRVDTDFLHRALS
jgi:predicted dinucleotide-utilizing enzyme